MFIVSKLQARIKHSFKNGFTFMYQWEHCTVLTLKNGADGSSLASFIYVFVNYLQTLIFRQARLSAWHCSSTKSRKLILSNLRFRQLLCLFLPANRNWQTKTYQNQHLLLPELLTLNGMVEWMIHCFLLPSSLRFYGNWNPNCCITATFCSILKSI